MKSKSFLPLVVLLLVVSGIGLTTINHDAELKGSLGLNWTKYPWSIFGPEEIGNHDEFHFEPIQNQFASEMRDKGFNIDEEGYSGYIAGKIKLYYKLQVGYLGSLNIPEYEYIVSNTLIATIDDNQVFVAYECDRFTVNQQIVNDVAPGRLDFDAVIKDPQQVRAEALAVAQLREKVIQRVVEKISSTPLR